MKLAFKILIYGGHLSEDCERIQILIYKIIKTIMFLNLYQIN
jgi:hypothetical protein